MAVTDATGTLTSQQRYLPFGGQRTLSGYSTTGLTDYGYTGQRDLDPDMGGLMDYKARFYSPMLGRFIQPDSLIPSADNPQAWNRFSYVINNPINFNDPTGHKPVAGCGNDGSSDCHASDLEIAINAQKQAELEYDPTGKKQKRNQAIAKAILEDGSKLIVSVLFEPADWALTINDCVNGDCSVIALVMMAAPVVSGNTGKTLYRVINKADPQYLNFLETGKLAPRGGPSTLIEHVNGINKTNSNFTSWTVSPKYAESLYDETKVMLKVDPTAIPNTIHDSFMWSNFIIEAERTIEGVIESGIEVVK